MPVVPGIHTQVRAYATSLQRFHIPRLLSNRTRKCRNHPVHSMTQTLPRCQAIEILPFYTGHGMTFFVPRD